MAASTLIPLSALPELARLDLFRRVETGALLSNPLSHARRAEARAWGAGLAGILGVTALVRGFGDPYHGALRLDFLGWGLLVLGFGVGLFLLRAWAREQHYAHIHRGPAGNFLLTEGWLDLREGLAHFRPTDSICRVWRVETFSSTGEPKGELLQCHFLDGQVRGFAPGDGGMEAFRAAVDNAPEGPGVDALLGLAQTEGIPDSPLPTFAALRPLHLGLAMLLSLPAVGFLRNELSDERGYLRAKRDENPTVWNFYASRTRRHREEACQRAAAEHEAWKARWKSGDSQ